MTLKTLQISILFFAISNLGHGAETNVEVRTEGGGLQVVIDERTEEYAVLYRSADLLSWKAVALSVASNDDRTLADPIRRHDRGFYRVDYVRNDSPTDLDGDGRSDLEELEAGEALNPAEPLPIKDGAISIPDSQTFEALAKRDNFPGAQNVKEVKFLITEIRTNPKVHFLNVNHHQYHYDFASNVLKYDLSNREFNNQTYFSNSSRNFLAGSLVSHESYKLPDGSEGIFTMEFWPTDPVAFNFIELAYELISASAPHLEKLFFHPPGQTHRTIFEQNREKFDASFVHTIQSEELFGNLTYQPMIQREAFGRLRLAGNGETLSARDIVIFKNLPNDLSVVAGIITEVPQTPLSHVNLKATQNETPNAFISEASSHPDIAPFLGKNVFYRVGADGFEIREASQEELDDYFDSIRPDEVSFPVRNLSRQEIIPLTQLRFTQSDSYGSKAANVAELNKVLPANAPDGFAVPYYFYDEFMKHNGFYQAATAMMAEPQFINDAGYRESALEAFRKRLEDESALPPWMFEQLSQLQSDFPSDRTPRVRSSANAEDTTGFNGAGLYDSFTHKENEGHIGKSMRQVWASLWNYRAYEEREFYRIDHLTSAMGVLVHPREKDEQANGVAVARNIFDPNWEGYYINVQEGENLVTNPDANSVPEEMLVADLLGANRYEIQYIRFSNQVPEGETVISQAQVLDLVNKMARLNSHFKNLYDRRFDRNFAMEIEFKITEEGILSIKQARPYVN